MAINLSNLKISLDKFNEAAKGTYNIGHIKLGADCKSVYRTNNHKTWTIFNNTGSEGLTTETRRSFGC